MRIQRPIQLYGAWRWSSNDDLATPCKQNQCGGHHQALLAAAHHALHFCEAALPILFESKDTQRRCVSCSAFTSRSFSFQHCPYDIHIAVCSKCNPMYLLKREHLFIRKLNQFIDDTCASICTDPCTPIRLPVVKQTSFSKDQLALADVIKDGALLDVMHLRSNEPSRKKIETLGRAARLTRASRVAELLKRFPDMKETNNELSPTKND